MMKLEHIVVDNEYFTTNDDDVKSIHLTIQESPIMEAANPTNDTATSSGANKDTEVTVL